MYATSAKRAVMAVAKRLLAKGSAAVPTDCPTCGHAAKKTDWFMGDRYEPVGCTGTADLRERIAEAATDLEAKARTARAAAERRRLEAKAEGVRLILSYVDAVIRGGR